MTSRITLLAFLAMQVLMPVTCHAKNSNDFFNGYYPGMSLTNAKRIGVENCHVGGNYPENSLMVYCHPTAGHSRLGTIFCKEASLRFNRRTGVLSEIQLIFDGSQTPNVITEMEKSNGIVSLFHPGGHTEYSWQRDDDIVITGYGSERGRIEARNLSITFTFEPGRARLVMNNSLRNVQYENAKKVEAKRYESQ